MTNLATTHYLVGSAIGPHPFPTLVRDYQRVIGREIKSQLAEVRGKLPDVVVACVGGGSNAIGTFYDFIGDKDVRLIGVEAGGDGKGRLMTVSLRARTDRTSCDVFDRGAYSTTQRDSERGNTRRAARRSDVSPSVTDWTDHRDPLRQRRTGLSRCRSRARLVERHGTCGVRRCDR